MSFQINDIVTTADGRRWRVLSSREEPAVEADSGATGHHGRTPTPAATLYVCMSLNGDDQNTGMSCLFPASEITKA